MDKGRSGARLRAFKPSARRLVQLYSALLYNAQVKGFITGEIYRGSGKALCVPGLNCYSCPGAVGACPLGALQNALAASGHRAGWYVLGILLLYGVILGRTVCGWLCPFGWIQELLHKIPTPKLRKSRGTRALSLLKYGVLAVFAIGIPLWNGLLTGVSLPAFCKYICPAGTLEGAMGLLPANPSFFSMLGWLFTRKFVIMVAVGLACVFCYRSFCRFLCPLGAIYSLFHRFNLIGAQVDAGRCSRCGACVRNCEMDVRHVGDRECIHCGKCVAVCAQGAISIKAGKIVLKGPDIPGAVPPARHRKRGRIAWGAALLALVIALAGFNLPFSQAQEEKAPDWSSDAPAGWQKGQRLEDFSVECLDGSVFHLADTRGKVTMINLWATWCAPCIQELPYFSALSQQHGDGIAILALHSGFVTDDPAAYLADRDFSLTFAVDSEDERLFHLMNGSATLPQTIVLNRRGEVIYNQIGSVTPEMLAALYEEANQ